MIGSACRFHKLNVANYVCTQWVDDPPIMAIYYENSSGNEKTVSFQTLVHHSNQMAKYLRKQSSL